MEFTFRNKVAEIITAEDQARRVLQLEVVIANLLKHVQQTDYGEMKRILGELVTIVSSRGLQLHGVLYRKHAQKTTVIHIHGSLGNFYGNSFIPVMARLYSEARINFLSINTGCHDGIAEGDRKGVFEYVGGSRTDFAECLYDLEGAVAYAERFSDRIILQGHSLGCDRVLYYLLNSRAHYEFVLLSPCDSYQLQVNWIAPETVEEQIRRLRANYQTGDEFDWLPSREYGVRQSEEWTYSIPVTRKALLSIMEGPIYRLINIKQPAEFHLKQRALIYIGGKDALQVWPYDIMIKYLRGRIGNVQEVYVPYGDHMLSGCEEDVIEQVIQWASSDTGSTAPR